MRYVRLIAVEDQFDTDPGLVIRGTNVTDNIFADREGGTLPHDLLEHQNGAHLIGEVWDEMQAEGAFWFIRGRVNGLFDGAAGDLCSMARDSLTHEWRHPNTRAHDHDDDFHDILNRFREMAPHEDLESGFPIDQFCLAALHNMRAGFNKAMRRGHTRAQFDAIRDVLNRNTIDFVDQEFILGFGNNEATIREVYYD